MAEEIKIEESPVPDFKQALTDCTGVMEKASEALGAAVASIRQAEPNLRPTMDSAVSSVATQISALNEAISAADKLLKPAPVSEPAKV